MKLLVFGGLMGLLVIEGGSLVMNRIQAHDLASEAATEANITYERTPDIRIARARAEEYVSDKAQVVDVGIDQVNRRLAVTLQKTARTFLVHRVGAFADWATVIVTESVPLRR